MGTAADVVEVGVVDDDADGEVGVVVVGEDPRGAFGRPFPCASASPGSARPTKRNRPIAEGRERYLTTASRYFAAGAVVVPDVVVVDPLTVVEPVLTETVVVEPVAGAGTGAGAGAVRTCFAA